MRTLTVTAVVLVLLVVSAGATVVTSIAGGSVTAFPQLNYFGTGPQTFGNGITWTSTFFFSVFGYGSTYDYGTNGYWDRFNLAGTNSPTEPMTFAFATPVTEVGGFLNYNPRFGNGVIAAYDSGNKLIESYTLSFATGGGLNTGAFYGFQESTPIAYFTLSGAFIGITNLTTLGSSSTPEPSSLLLLGTGLAAGIGALRRKISV
jgi:hypothetical protein